MSVSLRKVTLPHPAHFDSAGRRPSTGVECHASTPSRSKSSTILRFNAGSMRGLSHPSHLNTAMGTPQMRCRLMHQSGRVAIILVIRSLPHAGSQTTLSISSIVNCLKVFSWSWTELIGVSSEMNHCSVARKITGLWQRQQCG